MSRLDTLPSEIWRILTSFISGGDIYRLWCTGSHLVSAKLVNGGAAYYESEPEVPELSLKPELGLITQLKLILLDLDFNAASPTEFPGFSALGVLPQTLITLILRGCFIEGFWTERVCKDASASNSPCLPAPCHRNLLQMPDVGGVLEGEESGREVVEYFLFNTAAQFPCLQSLEIHGRPEVSSCDGEELENGNVQLDLLDDHIKIFPPSLTHLHVHMGSLLSSNCLRWLPSSLTSFSSPWNTVIGHGESASYFPQDLLSLKLGNCTFLEDDNVWRLPSHLTELVVKGNSLTAKGSIHFPSTLRRLSIYHCNRLDFGAFNHLPDAIEYLYLDLRQPFAETKVQRMPLNLKSLSLAATSPLSAHFFSLLPNCFEYLDILSGNHFNNSTILLLPRNLQTLFASTTSGSLSSPCFSYLPPTLTKLVIYNPISISDPLHIRNLPGGLLYMHLNFSLSDVHLPLLPRPLLSLHVGQFGIQRSSSLSQLPPNLRSFWSVTPLYDNHSPLSWTDADIAFFPPSIERFSGPKVIQALFEAQKKMD